MTESEIIVSNDYINGPCEARSRSVNTSQREELTDCVRLFSSVLLVEDYRGDQLEHLIGCAEHRAHSLAESKYGNRQKAICTEMGVS